MALDVTGKMWIQDRTGVITILEVCPHPHDRVRTGFALTPGCPDCKRLSQEALQAWAAYGETKADWTDVPTVVAPEAPILPVVPRPWAPREGGLTERVVTAQAPIANPLAELEAYVGRTALEARKAEVGDVTAKALAIATAYAKSYTGDFSFMVEMAIAAKSSRGLSVSQAKGVINCMRAEILRTTRQAAATVAPVAVGKIDFASIPDGRYAVEHGEETAYYTIGTSKNGSGKRHVCILSSDERIYVGTILPNGEYRGKHENLLREVAKDPESAGLLFGRTIGKCCRCGRTLTDASSREAGIGPECAQKGWS